MSERAELVGRYATDDGRQRWTLDEDGSCRIDPPPPAIGSCEWLLAIRDGDAELIVSVLQGSHRTRYVLTPRRLPGGRVTFPLGPEAGQLLRKVD